VLFATSLKAEAGRGENMDLICRWTRRLNAHLTLLHVLAGARKDTLAEERNCKAREEQLRALLPAEALRDEWAHACVRSGQVSREILAAAGRVDLIALGAVRSPLLGRFAAEGTLYKVLAEARCPVATLHSEHAPAREAAHDAAHAAAG